jgi:hypothetical protein
VVTQIIRLRAINKITRSQDALRVIEIEDLPTAVNPSDGSHLLAIYCRSRESGGTAQPEA